MTKLTAKQADEIQDMLLAQLAEHGLHFGPPAGHIHDWVEVSGGGGLRCTGCGITMKAAQERRSVTQEQK